MNHYKLLKFLNKLSKNKNSPIIGLKRVEYLSFCAFRSKLGSILGSASGKTSTFFQFLKVLISAKRHNFLEKIKNGPERRPILKFSAAFLRLL